MGPMQATGLLVSSSGQEEKAAGLWLSVATVHGDNHSFGLHVPQAEKSSDHGGFTSHGDMWWSFLHGPEVTVVN